MYLFRVKFNYKEYGQIKEAVNFEQAETKEEAIELTKRWYGNYIDVKEIGIDAEQFCI